MMKYIEIVPLDNFNNCSDVTDVKQEQVSVKVCVACSFSLLNFQVYVQDQLGKEHLSGFFHNLTAIVFSLFTTVLQAVHVMYRLY